MVTPARKKEDPISWAIKNWKLLVWAAPLALVFADNLIGPALTGKKATAAIQTAIKPIVDAAVQGARKDMDTLKYEIRGIRQSVSDVRQDVSNIKSVVIRLPGAEKHLRRMQRENRERIRRDSIRDELFGPYPLGNNSTIQNGWPVTGMQLPSGIVPR